MEIYDSFETCEASTLAAWQLCCLNVSQTLQQIDSQFRLYFYDMSDSTYRQTMHLWISTRSATASMSARQDYCWLVWFDFHSAVTMIWRGIRISGSHNVCLQDRRFAMWMNCQRRPNDVHRFGKPVGQDVQTSVESGSSEACKLPKFDWAIHSKTRDCTSNDQIWICSLPHDRQEEHRIELQHWHCTCCQGTTEDSEQITSLAMKMKNCEWSRLPAVCIFTCAVIKLPKLAMESPVAI